MQRKLSVNTKHHAVGKLLPQFPLPAFAHGSMLFGGERFLSANEAILEYHKQAGRKT